MNSREIAQATRDKLFEEPTFQSFNEETLRFIGWVTLAPSTHNTQPWKFDISDGEVTVSLDKEKAVAMADPKYRDMFMSAGTLMRHVEIVGIELGNVTDLIIDPNEESEEVARFTLKSSKKWNKFLSSERAKDIASRQNYRGKYSKRAIEPSEVVNTANRAINETMRKSKIAFYVYDIESKQAQELCRLTTQGIADAYKSPEFRTEVADHINSNFSKNETGLHGYSLTMNSLLSIILPKVMRKKDIGGKLSNLNRRGILGSQGMVVVTTTGDTAIDWVDAGRAMIDLIIQLKSRGIQTSIYAAAIEMGTLRNSVHEVISQDEQYAQLIFTYGYPSEEIGFSHRQSSASITTFR